MTNTIDADATEVAQFRAVFAAADTAHDVGPRFTCKEVDALAGMLRAIGADDAAAVWIEGHSWGDDDVDDLHRRPEVVAN
jgi:FMN-dependent NADH-azoreductase